MSETNSTPKQSIAFEEYIKGYVAGFYNPVMGIKNLSMKLSTGNAIVFSLVGALILYALEVLSRLIVGASYMTFSLFLNIAFTSFMTYGIMTFGVAGVAFIASKLQNTVRKYSELVSASTMAVIPGALVRILWGRFGGLLLSNVGSFFWALGTAYMAILLFEHIKDENLSGRKQFLTAAIIVAACFAVAAAY